MNILKALVDAFRCTFLQKKLYRKLLAYGSIITDMKYADELDNDVPSNEWKPNDRLWIGELPTIYELDIITCKMNKDRDDINKTFKLSVKTWDRDEIRRLMDIFEYFHYRLCEINKRKLMLVETCARLIDAIETSFWTNFKVFISQS